jgi:hypothetical protein
MTFWIILILVVAVLLILGIDRLMARFGIRPVHPEETRTGVHQIATGVERWADRRNERVASRRDTPDHHDAPGPERPAHRDAQNS